MYQCDKEYNFEILDELQIQPEKEVWYGIVFIHGRVSEFWKVSNIQSMLMGSVETTTQKRQRKGGSSSARISRLRENKRDRNVSFVSEELEKIFYDWDNNRATVSGLIIAGSSQTSSMILNELDDGLRSILIREEVVPWQDCNALDLYKHIGGDIEKFHITEERKLLEPLHEIIATNPDLLDYGMDNIRTQLHLYKTIYCNKNRDTGLEHSNIVSINYLSDLDDYDGIIAVRYIA
jgi:peptide subunit release factor 1 (eRF1)